MLILAILAYNRNSKLIYELKTKGQENAMSVGSIVAIFTAPRAGAKMEKQDRVSSISGCGLVGDRYATGEGSFNKKSGMGNRQVTLMNARFFVGRGMTYAESRRNIFTANVELMWLIGHEFEIGEATFRGVKYCDPCVLPPKLAQKTDIDIFKREFEDCGGLVAEVIKGGLIRVGNVIVPPPKGY